ncbi:MAG: porin family protein [Hyphomicrobiales bacterium]|nr:porin family protein [Hyphomicrobiales bacterium]
MKIAKSFISGALLTVAAGTAMAADLPSRKAPPPSYIAPMPVFSWSGFYVGVNGGGFINNSTLTTAVASGRESGGGFLIGGTAGYNWQLSNNFVVGLEADVDYRSTTTVSTGFTSSSPARDGFFGTVRGRLGYAWDRLMIYGTAGGAFGNAIAPNVLSMPFYGYYGQRSPNNGGTKFGWTAGVGAEYALTNNWSIKAEYLYADLGKKTLAYVSPFSGLTTGLVPTDVSAHVIRAGVNYRFNWGLGAPVLAKY